MLWCEWRFMSLLCEVFRASRAVKCRYVTVPVGLSIVDATWCSDVVTELAWMESLPSPDLRRSFNGQGGSRAVSGPRVNRTGSPV